MYKLYDFLPSGNGYKVRLALTQLEIPFQWREMDILAGETRTPDYLAKNPNGRIPMLEIQAPGQPPSYLSESHAILSYLCQNSPLIPTDKLAQAHMWQWLCFEQYHLEPNIGVLRFWKVFQGKSAQSLGQIWHQKAQNAHEALQILEIHLSQNDFVAGATYSMADIGLYAYIHVAEEGGISLDNYPHLRAWLSRVATQPNHRPITWRPSASN